MTASLGSSPRTWRTNSILLARPAIESCWTSSESIGYQMIPSTALQKQISLLKESGFGNCGSLVMCFACLKMSLSENLQCMFLLMGGGNPEDSERYSPKYSLSSGGSWLLAKWPSAVGNGSRPPSMEETCGRLFRSRRMMMNAANLALDHRSPNRPIERPTR